MYKFLITFIVLFISNNGFAQKISTNDYEVKTTLADFNLKGKVEKIISTATEVNGDSTTLPFYENEYYDQVSLEFNPKGLLTKRTNYLDYRGKLAVYNYVNYDYNNYNVISRASLENEPNFIITIISDGSSYRMTAVR